MAKRTRIRIRVTKHKFTEAEQNGLALADQWRMMAATLQLGAVSKLKTDYDSAPFGTRQLRDAGRALMVAADLVESADTVEEGHGRMPADLPAHVHNRLASLIRR